MKTHRSSIRWVLLVAPCLIATACVAPNSYVSHGSSKKMRDHASDFGCVTNPYSRTETRACQLVAHLEVRRGNKEFQAEALSTSLLAIGAHVGYQATRKDPSRAIGGVAAVGVFAYAWAAKSKWEQKRIAYSRGVSAISCSRAAYDKAFSSDSKRRDLMRKVIDERNKITASMPAKDILDQVDKIDATLVTWSGYDSLETQYYEFLTNSINSINTLIEGTIPSMEEIAKKAAELSNVQPTKPLTSMAGNQVAAAVGSLVVRIELTEYVKAAQELLDYLQSNSAKPADFSKCEVVTAEIGGQSYLPLQLGAGNADNGRSFVLRAGQPPKEIPLIDGRAPFSVSVETQHADAPPKAEIVMQGGILLRISPPATAPSSEMEVKITVSDALNAVRHVSVTVPQ